MNKTVNIIMAGVGGQGLVLMTDIISEVAFEAGYDVKTNDVVGLSQRGGKVWGSVRLGETIHSPNIAKGHADYLLALEPLEGLRWQEYLKPQGQAFINTAEIYPVFAIAEAAPYPHDFLDQFRKDIVVSAHDVLALCLELGTPKVVNVMMLGALAKQLPIDSAIWRKVIGESVPEKFFEENMKAFEKGMTLGSLT
ncbi:MAG: indolepyruvate oxidoreductase subunit beta [Firmicutes bacterium]|nr:indolepyruvate oxidoreductase subunit beta [Bacillota bacterium]